MATEARKPWECPVTPGQHHEGKRYCGLCGTAMFWLCTNCGSESPLWAKFCTTCGERRDPDARLPP
jgi:hypothetical protein